MLSLSETEAKIMAEMEFKNKSYFTTKDIEHLIPTKSQIKDVIYAMRKKGRIVSLNKNKYFIVPMKSRIGSWTDEPFVIADEMMNSSNYYIGGWASANYWRLTDQIPSKFEIYTNKRNGRSTRLNTHFIFRKTTPRRIEEAQTIMIKNHIVKILNKEMSQEWLKKKQN